MEGAMTRVLEILTVVVLAGCFTYGFDPSPQYLDAPETNPNEIVFLNSPPQTQPYVDIGKVTVECGKEVCEESNLWKHFKEQAASYGCNAIVMDPADSVWASQNNGIRGSCVVWQ
jgi:hypothetical protein